MRMLTFRRCLLVAGILLSVFLLVRHSHLSHANALRIKDSPSPTGEYVVDKKPADYLGGSTHEEKTEQAKPATSKHWDSDNGGRVALAQKPLQQLDSNQVKMQPLRKQLAYAFPYSMKSKFPPYIWQTWKYTPADGRFQEEYRGPEASWTEKHPEFIHEVVTDDVAVQLVRHLYAAIPEVHQAYEALPQPVLRADFFRYLILLARGGVYSDIDTTALKPVFEWVPAAVAPSSYGLVIGIEADPDRPDWQDWYARRIQFCQWTIQAKPGHPVLVDIVAAITEETVRRQRAGTLSAAAEIDVMEFTGPAIWTDTIFEFFNNPDYFDMATSAANITWKQFTGMTQARKVGDVIVLPITSFSPGVQQMGAGEIDDPMAFVLHAFQGEFCAESSDQMFCDANPS